MTEVTGESGGLLGRLRIEGPQMPEALARIAETILADPETAAHASIVDLAERSGTSTATVTRFSRTLGFKGYANLRVAIATETGRAEQARWETDISGDIAPGDPLTDVLAVVTTADTRAIQDTAAGLDVGAIEQVAAAIAEAKRVEIFGLGSSGTSAREMAFRLERIRVPVWHRTDSHTALTNAALTLPGDVAIGLSHSGRTREVIETLAEAADHGALTVAVTSFSRSPLAEVADVVFTTAVQETTFRLAALSALHSQLLVLDTIYVAVAQRTYERTADALELTVRAVDAHRLPEKIPTRKRGRPDARAQSERGRPDARAQSERGRPDARAQSERGRPDARAQSERGRPDARAQSERGRPDARAQSERGRPDARAQSERGRPKGQP